MSDRTEERVEREREILAHQARERERAEREEERRDLDDIKREAILNRLAMREGEG